MAKKKGAAPAKSTSHVQPVVAVVGHIDHGKTSLLDYIKKSRVAQKESGGITQKISAYAIEHEHEGKKRPISFIDTPGHEAFQEMRRRGASAADIAILVVAADDGVKPQTLEAWNAIQDAKIPVVVAFTKIDKDTANIEKAKESVLKEGVYLEGLGGSIPFAAVSSKTGDGIDELLDLIILTTDLEEITCNPSDEPKALVIESARDPKSGVSATVIVRSGTFESGNFAVTPGAWAPLRIIEASDGTKVKSISCGNPAKIVGFSTEPKVGSEIIQVKTKKEAEEIAASEESAAEQLTHSTPEDGELIRLIIKADSLGSIEALKYELEKIQQEKVAVAVVDSGVGAINENDIKRVMDFSNAVVIGFSVGVDAVAKDLAERQGVTVETRDIIYELTEWFTTYVEKVIPEDTTPQVLGTAKIKRHFSTTGTKHVVGGKVEEGVLKRGSSIIIERRGIDVGTGKIVNIQSQKNDVESISDGEFGAQIETKADIVGGDVIKAISAR